MNPLFTLILSSGLSLAVFAASVQAQQREPSKTFPEVNIRLLSQDMFCKNLQLTFAQYAATNGYNNAQTKLLASTATQMVVQEFRNGRASEYMNTAALAHYADQPDLAQKDSYLQMSKFIGIAMGLSPNVSFALSTDELRFISYAQPDMDIIVIAQNAAPLTPERTQKIIDVATGKKIRISVLWVGPKAIDTADLEQTRLLGLIVGTTGGFLTNLGGSDAICGTLM